MNEWMKMTTIVGRLFHQKEISQFCNMMKKILNYQIKSEKHKGKENNILEIQILIC